MSLSISGASPYSAYSYTPPQPDPVGMMDEGVDFGMDDIAPVDFSQVMPVINHEQFATVNAPENARGSDRDSFRREHSTVETDLREIQAVMIGFSSRRMLEL